MFTSKVLNVNDEDIQRIKEFLNSVSINRNEVYEKICEIGATSPKYFEERDDIVNSAGASDIDNFYATISECDFANISEIMRSYFRNETK